MRLLPSVRPIFSTFIRPFFNKFKKRKMSYSDKANTVLLGTVYKSLNAKKERKKILRLL